ncbi:MAG TPA: DNA (cytosine-5-)-methyltransferase [Thermomicrobiales bacterium]|nr:DNA (cytosine-5-)-methyltransferase [Thermomicrobiales bacterium]
MRVAEFFAGIGLVRMALEQHGAQVLWANDIDRNKREMYGKNFGTDDFVLDDIRNVRGESLPDVDVATASFPCTDLSLAGNRLGLLGEQSGLFWEFTRVLDEMRGRRPYILLIENVPSFASSHGGNDLLHALARLNSLGYWCDLLVVDARHFVPQSRPRLFIVGSQDRLPGESDWTPSEIRPPWVQRFVRDHPELGMHALSLSLPDPDKRTLADVVDRLTPDDSRWWEPTRLQRFEDELSPLQRERYRAMQESATLEWATAYRRTRNGKPAWEIRGDSISGCLRTARGGSSKQAVVEAGFGAARVRWMTGNEYARLQGAEGYRFDSVSEGRILFGFGDAVCVPVISWLTRDYLIPLLATELTDMQWGIDRMLVGV